MGWDQEHLMQNLEDHTIEFEFSFLVTLKWFFEQQDNTITLKSKLELY